MVSCILEKVPKSNGVLAVRIAFGESCDFTHRKDLVSLGHAVIKESAFMLDRVLVYMEEGERRKFEVTNLDEGFDQVVNRILNMKRWYFHAGVYVPYHAMGLIFPRFARIEGTLYNEA